MSNAIYDNIDDYIAQFPKEIQEKLAKLRKIFHEAAPGAEEAMAYAIPTLRLNGKNLVHFAGFKEHVGVFPTPAGVKLAKENGMAENAKAKGTLQFPNTEEIPYEKLKDLVKLLAARHVTTN